MAALLLTALLFLFLTSMSNRGRVQEEDKEGPLVQVEQGLLRGLRGLSVREKEFLAFLGIPYAKPPTGELRFKAPRPPEPWNGTFEATEEGSSCPQIGLMSQKKEGDENCLFLNVFTNKLPEDPNDLKAVMVWIHGGAFVAGSATSVMFGPDHLLTEDIVFVSINYRLGILGFLSLPGAGIPGNNGMKDQVMALRWVQKNIAKFGGDPNRVTIFGQSAGGASAHFHLLSPMSTGLFHGAISQSGTGLASWAYAEPEYIRGAAFKIGAKIRCDAADDKELLQCFRETPATDFVDVFGYEDETGVSLGEFRPTKEDGSVNGEEVFLPGRPAALVSSRKFHVVPFLTGINSKEALTFTALTEKPSFWDKFDKNFDKVVADVTGEDVSRVKEVSERIKRYYFGDRKPSEETLDSFIDCFTDFSFFIGADRAVKKHAAFSTAPVYYYYFEFEGDLGVAKRALNVTKPVTLQWK
ncbi:hypothetical protein B7P43_G10280 [Cryptotermes secundus]|uniref:Carboxylic ester hydrolase n=1 Tax=Cryptotermes secundus TaxID=105785 RepID=A0A2J7RMS8_9NEOP|nr:esterase FE4 isoform X2 [Cryptotermes secundus]PNF42140.1 hypothetical protein B7P43_G10280 [Cryptotermes secundus]